MRRKMLVLLLICEAVVTAAHSQFQDAVPQIKPLPPEATSIFRVVDRPIGGATGTVPVNFPLCSISSGPLSANLSLNYIGTGGVKVEENASSVGLGFSFSDGGGRIIQVVNGLPDDQGMGMLHNAHRPSTFNCFDVNELAYAAQGMSDLEPDIFYYDFNGVSGKFFFKENGTIVLGKHDGIKIEYDYLGDTTTGIKKWIITDEKGNKYYFGKNKANTVSLKTANLSTYSNATGGGSKSMYTSYGWYLTEARDMNEENVMTYTYQSCSGTWNNTSGGYMVLYKSGWDNCTYFNINPSQTNMSTGAGEYILSSIQTANGSIMVNSSADRKDAPWGRKINSIQVRDTLTGLIKKINFNYDYFNSWSTDANILRLKLKNFSEFGSSGTDSLCYSFTYNEGAGIDLPTRSSNSVDYWGFYNGIFNSQIYPNVVYPVDASTIIIQNGFANRIAVAGYAQSDILTKITYPTGGYRQFFYEGNSALLFSGYKDQWEEPEYMANRSFNNAVFSAVISPNACQKDTFTVNSVNGGAKFTYNLSGVGVSCSGYTVKLFKTTTQGALTGGGQIGLTLTNTSFGQWDLVNGYYRLEIYKPSTSCTFSSTTGSWSESTLSTATLTTANGSFSRNNRRAGGVRVKEVRDYDPVSGTTNSTQYYYKMYSLDSTLTSGILVTPIQVTHYDNPGSSCPVTSWNISSCYPMGSQGGSYVMYPEVRTVENGNGWTDRLYSFSRDYPQGSFPIAPNTDGGPGRSLLLQEKSYRSDGTLLKKSVYTYVVGFQDYQYGHKSKPYYFSGTSGVDRDNPQSPGMPPTHADCSDYQFNAYGYVPGTTIDSVFNAGGKFASRVDRSYVYYGTRPCLKQSTKAINNSAAKFITYKYPFTANSDFTFGLTTGEQTTKTTLLGNNYMQALEIVDSLRPTAGAGSLLSGGKLIFGTFNGSKLHPSQSRSYTTLGDSTVINFTQYDSNGNLQEEYKTGDNKAVYLWGYNNMYPVAKVVGSTYAIVSALVNNSILQNPSSDAALQTELNKIRTGLAGSKAQVTTYTYSRGIGISSMVDPSGKTMYYRYDVFGRLQLIKDQDGNILKKYSYNYLTP